MYITHLYLFQQKYILYTCSYLQLYMCLIYLQLSVKSIFNINLGTISTFHSILIAQAVSSVAHAVTQTSWQHVT